jgi:hypothetical protein
MVWNFGVKTKKKLMNTIKRKNVGHMVAPLRYKTNEPLNLIVGDAIFCMLENI